MKRHGKHRPTTREKHALEQQICINQILSMEFMSDSLAYFLRSND